MVQHILQNVYKEIRGLHQAAYILAIFTFGSQLLALIRDRLLAHQFGAGAELDLYYTAFRIPDFLYVLFASTLSVYVLIPFIAKHIEEKNYIHAKALLSQIFSLFLLVYIAVALSVFFFAPQIVFHVFPGFVAQSDTLVILMRIILIQPLLLGISALYGVITQLDHRFILYAISPLLYNLGIIFGLLFLYPYIGLVGLAIGVVLGAFGHLLIQIPYVSRSTILPRFTFKFHMDEIFTVLRTSLTRAVTLSLHQIVLLGLVGFASIMTIGSVSVFQFAYNLQSVPLAIIGVSYSVAAFPLLAQLFAEEKFEVFRSNITTALRHILFWSLPIVTLFVVIRAQFVRVVLGSGEFDWSDTRLTAAILALFIISLTAQAMHLLLVRAMYAVGNTRLPFYITLFTSSLALIFSFYFYSLLISKGEFYEYIASIMRLEGVAGIEVLALPIGYSCALILHSILMLIFTRHAIFLRLKDLLRPFLQSVVSALFAGYVSYISLNYFVKWFTLDTLINVFLQGSFAFIIGFAGYVLCQRILRSTELGEMTSALHKKFGKGDVLMPQDEDQLSL